MKETLLNYLQGQGGVLSLQGILLSFFMALVLGMVIYLSYRFSHSGAVYSARFNVSLVMLTIVTTLVMNVIGNNIALSLGMVGALSIVRFRTAVKDPRDTTYIFWCIAVGVCCGVAQYIVAAIGSAVIFLFLLIFGVIKANDRFLLIIHADREAEKEIEQTVMTSFKGKEMIRVKNTTAKKVEYIYELSQRLMKKAQARNISITEALYQIESVEAVNIVCQNEEISR